MSNVHGLFSNKKDDDDKDDDDDENNRYVGGIGDHGGGSGLAVRPNIADEDNERDSVFRLAQNASADDSSQVRRTITMYRDGFVVDDGPYRRLDDPANADFLRALAMGRTPRELMEDEDGGNNNVVVGLVDKRSEAYVEEFRSFSGQGNTLGSTATAASASVDGVYDPALLSDPPTVDESSPRSTLVQVRLLNGTKKSVRILLSQTVSDLAAHLRHDSSLQSFRLVAGFPPKPLVDPNATIEGAGLKGAQVTMQKAA